MSCSTNVVPSSSPPSVSICEQPFWSNPSVLYKSFNLEYMPQCTGQIWNLITRLVIIAIVSGILMAPLLGGVAILISLVFASVLCLVIILNPDTSAPPENQGRNNNQGKGQPSEIEIQLTPTVITTSTEGFDSSATTAPSSRNPFMNVLIDEYGSNIHRSPAASVSDPVVKQTMDDYFRVQWFSDPTDVFGKNQGQRQYVTQPSTSIPNDRESYQNWLYKIPGKTCKEGGRLLCRSGTDGSPVTWINQHL